MNTERIRQRLANGFKPFAVHLSDGKRYVVPHPDFISLGKNVVVIVGPDDSVTTIDPLHIAAVEELGRRKRSA